MPAYKHSIRVDGKDIVCYQYSKNGIFYFKKDNLWHIVNQMQPHLKYERIDGRKVPQAVRTLSS